MMESLKDRVIKRMAFYLSVTLGSISFIAVAVLFITSSQNYRNQVNAWVTSFPRSILPNLVSGDHIGIHAKLRLIKSTGLFESITILDSYGRFVNGYGDDSIDTKEGIPIVDEVSASWGMIYYSTNPWKYFNSFVFAIVLSFLLFIITFYLVVFLSKRSVKFEFTSFNTFLDEIETLSKRIAAIPDDQTIDQLSSALKTSSFETDKIDKVIQCLILAIEKYRSRALQVTLRKKEEEEQIKRDKAIVQTTQLLAHDIRKPFSVLKAVLNDLDRISKSRRGKDEAKMEIELMIGNVDSMVNDIIDLSREANIELLPSPFKDLLEPAVRQTAKSFRKKESDIKLTCDLQHTYQPKLNKAKFMRVLVNILSNAVEAITEIGNRKHGTITVASQDMVLQDERKVQICIQNDGPPLNEKDIPNLFDLAFTQGKTQGVGLGLVSCRKIIQQHRGDIVARNLQGEKGVEFILTIPASDQKEDDTPDSMASLIDHFSHTDLGSCKILLLEDEALYRASVKNVVEQHEDLKNSVTIYDAHTVGDGLKILEQSLDIRFAIVDIDLGEELNGFDFIEKSKIISPDLSILIHSNHSFDADDVQFIHSNRIGFAPKPLSYERFMRFIKGLPPDTLETRDGSAHSQKGSIRSGGNVSGDKRQAIHILIIDDDRHILESTTQSLRNYFHLANTFPELTAATNFREAAALLDDLAESLTHVISDLNIDATNDGLLLAEKVEALNKKQKNKIDFYILTHADIERLKQDSDTGRVRNFFSHPLNIAMLNEVFSNVAHANSGLEKEPLGGERIDSKDCTLPELIEKANKQMRRVVRQVISHDAVGELNGIHHNVNNALLGNEEPEEILKALPFRLYSLAEPLSSLVDIVKCSEENYRENLFVVPFALKRFVDWFIQRQQESIPKQFNDFNIENGITDPDIRVVGDEFVFEKAVQKLFINLLRTCMNYETYGTVRFSAVPKGEMCTLVLTADVYNEDLSEKFINNLFYQTPWSSRHLKLDFVACGYLMRLIKGHVSAEIDPLNQTPSYCFSLEQETVE